MSYDLYLLAKRPGEDPMDVLERLDDHEVEADPEDNERVRRLGGALREALPALEDNAGDDAAPDELHLLDPDGLEVSIYPHSVAVTFPYWESLDTTALLRDLERVAAVVSEHTDWRMYDPQQEAWIDPLRDADGFREAFDHGRGIVRDLVSEDAPPATPWWRRWLRRP